MDPRYYGEVVHDFYDLIYPPYDVPEQVSFFQGIAAEGAKVLDLGAGTGRIAIPLAQAGFEVTGLDISQPMLDVLHDKDPLSSVTTALKDISVIDGAHEFDLVLCIGSTFFMFLDDLPRQNVFRNAAANLSSDGRFVVECYSPQTFLRGQERFERSAPVGAGDRVLLDSIAVDPFAQRVSLSRTLISPGTVTTFMELSRFAFPSELDLLASGAGLRLVSRHGGWNSTVADQHSPGYISVYRLADGESGSDPEADVG